MKQYKNLFAMLVIALATGLSLTACGEDDYDTNQYVGDVSLNVYGPSPVMRGGTLRFLGSNLDQIAQVEIPGVAPITSIEVVKAGIPSEIRVIVPHDGPEVGLVKLTSKNGKEIYTKTDLQYTEGLDPANISMPTSAMPGDKIRLTVSESGDDYLDLIHMVEFADGVQVGEDAFTAHNRYLIELIVPEDAKTGKLNLYTADLTSTETDANNVEYQIITTVNAIEIGVPSTSKIASPRGEADAQGTVAVKAGEAITLTGSFYNVVDDVTIGGISANDLTISGSNNVTFTVPAEAPDGEIVIVCKSGVEVPVGSVITVKPTEAVAAPQPVKAGEALTITGKDLDVVVSVEFPDAAAQSGDAITVAAEKIVVAAVPEKATEGNITLRMANGAGVEVAYTLVKPTVTGYDNTTVSAGGALTIEGTDLDLIKTVQFGDGTTDLAVEPAADGKSITLSVPMDAKTGKPTLKLANGTTIEGPELTINEALFCYATQLPGDDDQVKAGESLILTVANGDKLNSVEINGTECQFVLIKNNTEVIIGVPDKAKKGAKVRLISSNGEITYTIDFIPNTEVTTVLWTGQAVADNWGDQPYVLSDAGQELKDAGVVAGDIISFHITPMEDDWKVQIIEGHWGPTYASICSFGNDTEGGKFTEYDLDANKGYFNLEVTQEMLDAAFTQQWWGGVFVLNGDNVIVDKITTTHYESVEETLWEGEALADDWGNQPYLLSDAGIELAEVGAKAGQIVYFYLTPTEADWKVQIYEGHWGPTYASICSFGNDTESGKFTEYDLDANNGKYGLQLTQEMLDAAFTQQWWGGTFLLNGDNIKCTKITIE